MSVASRKRRSAAPKLVRWAALGLGLLLALGGLWVLVSRPPAPRPLDQIDAASRARLEQVLRRSDREEARP